MTQPDGIHTIPVPRGMSVEQAWENIACGATLLDPQPSWQNVEVKDGRLVKVLPAEACCGFCADRCWVRIARGEV